MLRRSAHRHGPESLNRDRRAACGRVAHTQLPCGVAAPGKHLRHRSAALSLMRACRACMSAVQKGFQFLTSAPKHSCELKRQTLVPRHAYASATQNTPHSPAGDSTCYRVNVRVHGEARL